MKLGTLKSYFRHRGKMTKLYLINGKYPKEFPIAGFASNSREEGVALLVDVGPYVVYSFQRDSVVLSSSPYWGLRLEPGSRVTRKFQTHRRNVLRLRDPSRLRHLEQYFAEAWRLRET